VVRFQRQTLIPLEPASAFDLSLSIDAHVGSFASSGETAAAGVTTGIIGMGEFVTWRAQHFGITWTMTSVITAWDRPHRFVDEQRSGPFKSFWHEHRFTPVDDGTLLDDDVRFEAPLGPLGRIAEALVLRRYLAHLIDVRNEFLVVEATRG
jgi:ligand-binding SRPBCC domain-containing protein